MITTDDNGTRSITKLNATEWNNDTETGMSYTPGDGAINGRIVCLPFLRYWTRPSSAKLRKWADELLDGTGMVRDGAIEYISGGSVTAWLFRFYVRPASQHPRKEHRGIAGFGYCTVCGQKPTSTRFVAGRCRGSWDC